MSDKRGKGTITKTFSWPLKDVDSLMKAIELSGNRGFSSIIQELVKEWLAKQQAVIENNPIGLGYSVDTTNHWIDAMLEPEEQKAKQDIKMIQDPELISKISVRAKKINDAANARSIELWRISKRIEGVAFSK